MLSTEPETGLWEALMQESNWRKVYRMPFEGKSFMHKHHKMTLVLISPPDYVSISYMHLDEAFSSG